MPAKPRIIHGFKKSGTRLAIECYNNLSLRAKLKIKRLRKKPSEVRSAMMKGGTVHQLVINGATRKRVRSDYTPIRNDMFHVTYDYIYCN